MVVGITGSSGAGKSTVCEILKNKYGAVIIDADKIAKQLSQKGNEYLVDIVELFGQEILLENGELNRSKLANIIYNQHEKREQLNQRTFKHIRVAIKEKLQNILEENPKAVIAIDAPLLFEAGLEKICDFIIAVIAEDKELQIERIVQRDWITEEQAEKRLQAQKSNEFYTTRSKYVIANNGKLEEVEEQIEKIFDCLESS